jgi:uncharacterized phage protein gp47/JayE
MTAGLTSAGFEAKRLDDIIEDVKGRLRSSFGSGVETDLDEAVMVALLPILLEIEELWQGAQGMYDFLNKNNAEGVSLDNLGAIINIPRLAGTFSTVDVEVEGAQGTVIPAGTIRSVSSTLEPFQTTIAWTLPAVGSQPYTISMQALNDGPVACIAGTLTVGTLPAGVTSMINTVDAEVGTYDETDAEYRVGLSERLASLGAGTVPAIKAALLALTSTPPINSVTVFENDTDVIDSNLLPPHSIRALVEGGADQDIWDTLGVKKGAGTYTDGTEVGTYTDPVDGQTFPMRFSRPTLINMYVDVVVTSFDSTFGDGTPANGYAAIETAILAEGDTFQLGDDVTLPRLQSAVTSVPGIITYTLKFGKTATPTTDTTVVIATFEKADFDSSRTSVT